jgi:heterodisulfide reductase subunit B2
MAEDKIYALFPGCVIPTQVPFIEKLSGDIFSRIGLDIRRLDFNCCPYNGVKDADEEAALVLSARNLALAEKENASILSLCNGCAQTLIEANETLKSNSDMLFSVNKKLKRLDLEYKGTAEVLHFMMVFDHDKDSIRKNIKRPLAGLRIATHTGCHLLRPSRIIGFDSPEQPMKFDELIALLGATPVKYDSNALCCGNSAISLNKEMSLAMMNEKVSGLQNAGADCLAVCCPSCFIQFDRNQLLLKQAYGLSNLIPTVHIFQLMLLAFGEDNAFFEQNRSGPSQLKSKISHLP